MTDEGRRAEENDEEAAKQCSQPKPISQEVGGKKSWEDLMQEEELQSLQEKVEKAMLDDARSKLMELKKDQSWAKVSTAWPRHWKDLVHDEDGGKDMFGRRPQDGRVSSSLLLPVRPGVDEAHADSSFQQQ